jgi:hypothetical protein
MKEKQEPTPLTNDHRCHVGWTWEEEARQNKWFSFWDTRAPTAASHCHCLQKEVNKIFTLFFTSKDFCRSWRLCSFVALQIDDDGPLWRNSMELHVKKYVDCSGEVVVSELNKIAFSHGAKNRQNKWQLFFLVMNFRPGLICEKHCRGVNSVLSSVCQSTVIL